MKHSIATQVRLLNKRLNKLDLSDQVEVTYISNKLTNWYKFKKIPYELCDALIWKFTKILNRTWYGDEESEAVIKAYIYELEEN